jgi:hypothetical protein
VAFRGNFSDPRMFSPEEIDRQKSPASLNTFCPECKAEIAPPNQADQHRRDPMPLVRRNLSTAKNGVGRTGLDNFSLGAEGRIYFSAVNFMIQSRKTLAVSGDPK